MKVLTQIRFFSILVCLLFCWVNTTFAQMCFNDIKLVKPIEMLEVGTIWSLDKPIVNYGSTHRMYVVDKDILLSDEICGGNVGHTQNCGNIIDEKIVYVIGNDNSGTSGSCISYDKFYVDIIDVKFTYTHNPICGTIVLKNVSDPMKVQDMNESYDDLIRKNKVERVFQLQNFVLSDLTSYRYIIENFETDKIDTITSAIGDEISIPEGNYNIRLSIKGSDQKLFQSENVYFANANSKYKAPLIKQNTYTIYEGDSVKVGNFYAKNAGDYFYSIKNKQGCDSILFKNHVITKNSRNLLGFFQYLAVSELKVDSKNNVYFIAQHALPYTQSKLDLDPTSEERFYSIDRTKSNSELLVKLSPKGDLIWAHHFSSPSSIKLYSFDIGPDDRIYIAGDFNGNLDVDFDPNQEVLISNPDPFSRTKGFVVCIDENATFKWVKNFESQYGNLPQKLKVDLKSNVYVAGTFRGTFDADPGSGLVQYESGNYGDAFIVKLNSAGSYLWSTSISGSYQEEIRDLVVDQSRNSVFVLGRYQNTLNPNYLNKSETYPSNGNSEDIFLTKLNTSGAYGWTKTLGSPESEDAVDLKLDSKGNIVFSGNFGGEIDLNPNSGTDIHTVKSYENDLFVTKLTNSGDFVWAKTIGNKKYESNLKIAIDQNDYIYGFATHGDTLDVNPNAGVYNLMAKKDVNQAYFVKLSESGDLLWSTYFSNYINSSSSTEMTITFDNENNLIAAGSGAMLWESYILKIKQECNFKFVTQNLTKCVDYKFFDLTLTNTGVYQKIISKPLACDSIITLNFTKVKDFSKSVKDSICSNQTYAFGSQKLTKAGNYLATYKTKENCDSTVLLTLSIKTTGCTITAENNIENKVIQFFPNPVSHFLTIENLPIGEFVSVFDVLGNELKTQKIVQNETIFDFQDFPKGVYFIRAESQNFRILKD